MAAPISSSFLMSSFLFSLCLFCSLEKGLAFQPKRTTKSHLSPHTYTVQLTSLLPASSCSPSSIVPNKEATLKVVHRHGPCSQLHQGQANPDHAQILKEDQARVNSIHSRLSKKSATADDPRYQQDATTLPAKSGAILSTGNYIVTVGLGTPKIDLSLVFDTGSDITWTQCKPCTNCYNQTETIFDPSKSTSYASVSCTSAECTRLTSTPGIIPGCSSTTSTCTYETGYGDGSTSQGELGKERLTLSPSDVIDNILFGCGQSNQGLFGTSAGLLGLGRNKLSIVEQTAQKYNRFFSYCLPNTSSSNGYLTFGNSGQISNSIKYTPLSTTTVTDSFYGLQVLGIIVGRTKLSISESIFQSSQTIIDSGTVITRLPPSAYNPLRTEFRNQMSILGYPSTTGNELFDTCYDLSGYENKSIRIPTISFFFGGGTTLDLDFSGIFYVIKSSQVCLAFAPNSDDRKLAIFGNVQQKTFQVVYDIEGQRIGFGPGGC